MCIRDRTYGDGSWQGFIDKKRLDVTIDMGTETAVHSVSADFMQVVGAEVFLPESVTISISDDGANFTELKQYTFEVNRKEAIKFISISWEGSAEGRYIRYQARAGEEFGGLVGSEMCIRDRLKDGIYVIRLVPEKSLADGYLQMK